MKRIMSGVEEDPKPQAAEGVEENPQSMKKQRRLDADDTRGEHTGPI